MNVFENVAQQLAEAGFFTYFLPFIIFTAFAYALLKRSKVFGDSVVLNGVLAFSLGLLVFGSPFLLGIDLSRALSLFFVQAFSFLLVFFIGILISALFYPDLLKVLEETMKRRTTMYAMIALGLALFIISGLFSITYEPGNQSVSTENGGGSGYISEQKSNLRGLYILTTVLIIFIVIILIAGYVAKGGGA
ncbi:MAG: hypothetical protein J7K83_03455 [Candidatus Aenigmarchaeota archaeon]|nr:hypothetical protein [Candidatus Aenigmarchaeota archaeon]